MVARDTTTSEGWLAEFCARIGVAPPAPAQVDELLALAATAAHSSERIAAPLACWAAGVSGRPVEELARIAEEIE
ncbi:MAG: DUF6457 domain-containing protein [Solirubrobacterales bacterium]